MNRQRRAQQEPTNTRPTLCYRPANAHNNKKIPQKTRVHITTHHHLDRALTPSQPGRRAGARHRVSKKRRRRRFFFFFASRVAIFGRTRSRSQTLTPLASAFQGGENKRSLPLHTQHRCALLRAVRRPRFFSSRESSFLLGFESGGWTARLTPPRWRSEGENNDSRRFARYDWRRELETEHRHASLCAVACTTSVRRVRRHLAYMRHSLEGMLYVADPLIAAHVNVPASLPPLSPRARHCLPRRRCRCLRKPSTYNYK